MFQILWLWCLTLGVKKVRSDDFKKRRNFIMSEIFDFETVLIKKVIYCEARDSYFCVI